MLRLFFVLFFSQALCLNSFAQKLQILFYPNGQKAMEGHWHIGSYAVLPNTFLDFSHREYSNTERNRKIMNIPDYPGNYWELNEMLLKMECDGPMKMWYPDGKPMAEMNFEKGLINGIYTAYHENGNKAMQGILKDGMPDGKWQAWYMDGKLFFDGGFVAYTQDELQERWAAGYSLKTNPYAVKQILEYASEEFDTLRNDYAIATDGVRNDFVNAVPQTISRKNGKFTVYKGNGEKWAEMEFAANVRTGVWTLFERDNAVKYQLEYKLGKLIAVAEGKRPKELIAQYAARWAKEEKERQSASIRGEAMAEQIYQNVTWADEPPRFDGSIQQYLRDHVAYSSNTRIKDIQGVYVVRFYVEEDGRITRAIMEQGKSTELNKEIIRVIENMPRWKPGKHNNKAVSKLAKITLNFGLSADY